MRLRPIKSNREYADMIIWVDNMMIKNVRPNSPTGQRIRIALKLIKQYEDIRFAVSYKY